MDSKERILATLKGDIPDRVGRMETFWGETIARWETEGLPKGVALDDHFRLDIGLVSWADLSFRFPGEVIEDTEEYVIHRDGNGVLRKDFKRASGHTPHWMEHKLTTAADWWKYKERLTPDDDRVYPQTREHYDAGRAKGAFIAYSNREAYEAAWPVFGQVNLFTMMMDEPEVVKDIFDTYTDLLITLAQKILDQGCDFDGAWFFGDLGYRNATLFSPACYDQMLYPAHKRMCDFFNSLGKPVILHSCGKIDALIPRFIDAGFSAIQPLEAKCGQDVRELKSMYGDKITLFGNIDVRKLSGTKADIEEEIRSKMSVAAKGGRYIFHSDHSVPPTVSYENYLYALELCKRYGKY